MGKVEITKDVQEVIDYVLQYEPDVIFKVCKNCGRNLPMHKWFFQPTNNRNKDGYSVKCKECCSILYSNGGYKFNDMPDKYWYYYKIDEIIKLSRIMTDTQLSKYYNKKVSDIENVLYNVIKTNQKKRSSNLCKEEIIQIYKFLLNKERKEVPRGFYNNSYYVKVLLEYLISNILKWERNDFINNFSAKTLDKYKLHTVKKTRNLNIIIDIINDIYKWDIKMWELKKSNAGEGFWLNDNNIKEVFLWFKTKLQKDKNINNIYDAFHYGFAQLVSEYYLKGLFKIKYKNNCFHLFQEMYEINFDINYYNENYQIFNINTEPVSLKYNGIIYKLTDKYYELDDIKKTLINEVIKYCEINKKYPIAQDFKTGSGYISHIHIKKYFGKYSNIFGYILPLKHNVNHCWNIKENRINYIKYYCEEKCEQSILIVINSTENLKEWVFKYFNQNIIANEMSWANDYVPKIYDLLIEAYPQIKSNKILFDWEWSSFYPKNDNRRIEILRELVLYRLNHLIIDLRRDIPKYLNFPFIETIYPKLCTMIRKGKFKSFYEWSCLAFPEYRDYWNEKDFGMIVAKDNTVLSSFQEKEVYEFIKYNLNFKYIKFIGNKRNDKYTYSLKDISDYKSACPDFVVEYIQYENKKIKLEKPIIIEYYGYYQPNNSYTIFVEYIKKMKIKNKLYKSLNDILFIDLYPEDLKNNFEGIRNKFDSYLHNITNIKQCINM